MQGVEGRRRYAEVLAGAQHVGDLRLIRDKRLVVELLDIGRAHVNAKNVVAGLLHHQREADTEATDAQHAYLALGHCLFWFSELTSEATHLPSLYANPSCAQGEGGGEEEAPKLAKRSRQFRTVGRTRRQVFSEPQRSQGLWSKP